MKNAPKQKVVFCTYSSIYSTIVLKLLLACPDIEVVGIVNSTRHYKSGFSAIEGSLQYIRETGWFYSIYLFFITDFYRFMQFFRGKQSIHMLAKNAKIPIMDSQDINQQDCIQFVSSLTPDYLLSAHFNQLFKHDILAIPRLASINMHPSLLPLNRGVDPVFYGMLRKDELMGVTLHLIDDGFDTGNIITQERIDNIEGASLIDNNIEAFTKGGELAVDIISKSIRTTIIQHDKGNYDSWPSPEIVSRFRKAGNVFYRFYRVTKKISE